MGVIACRLVMLDDSLVVELHEKEKPVNTTNWTTTALPFGSALVILVGRAVARRFDTGLFRSFNTEIRLHYSFPDFCDGYPPQYYIKRKNRSDFSSIVYKIIGLVGKFVLPHLCSP